MVELIIILDEDKTDTQSSFINYKITSEDKEGHLSLLKKFILNYNINIDNINEYTSYTLSLELAKMGIMSIHIENRNIIFYMPNSLSLNQSSYIKNNLNTIKKYSIKIASINNSGVVFFDDDEEYMDRSMVNVLMKEVKKKTKLRKQEVESVGIKK